MRVRVLFLALASLLLAVPAFAADRVVDNQGAPCVSGLPVHPTISLANAAASPGETILVCAGNYVDNVKVTKAHLTFLAQGKVRLTSGGGTPSAFQIWADGITVQGFEIYGYSRYLECGISTLGGNGHSFVDNQVHDNGGYGICVNGGADHRVQYNVTNNNARLGILFAGVTDGEVSNNTMTNNGEWGISVGPCSQSAPTVHHNLGVGNGIRVYQCAAVVTNNTVRSEQPTTGKHGIWLQNADGAVVTRNAIQYMDTGVFLDDADNVAVSYNNISFSNVGLDVKNTEGATVTRNYATRSAIVDCRWDGTGSNTLAYNVCRTVDPAGAFD